jgi:hypothetical protein
MANTNTGSYTGIITASLLLVRSSDVPAIGHWLLQLEFQISNLSENSMISVEHFN